MSTIAWTFVCCLVAMIALIFGYLAGRDDL